MGVISSHIYTLLVDPTTLICFYDHFLPLIGRVTPEKNMIMTTSRICVFYSHDSTGEEEKFLVIYSRSERPASTRPRRHQQNTGKTYKEIFGKEKGDCYPVEFEPVENADPIKLICITFIMLTNFLFEARK